MIKYEISKIFTAFEKEKISNVWHLAGGGDCPCADCDQADITRGNGTKK